MLAYISEGPGLYLLVVIVSGALVGIGTYVHRTQKKEHFGNIFTLEYL